jgi:hypothetical protein
MPNICPRCYKSVHRCKATLWRIACKCVKDACCVCIPIAREHVFPRPCPCPNQQCLKRWADETKDEKEDDDTDYIVEHCACHDISQGKTSFHCSLCAEWVCQNCAQLKELPDDIEADDDNDLLVDSRATVCGPCKRKWLQYVISQLKLREARAHREQEIVAKLLADLAN